MWNFCPVVFLNCLISLISKNKELLASALNHWEIQILTNNRKDEKAIFSYRSVIIHGFLWR